MRRIILILALAGALALSGCVDGTGEPEDVGVNDSVDDEEDDENASESTELDDDNEEEDDDTASDADEGGGTGGDIERVDGDGYTEFSGSGAASTETLTVEEGLAIVSVDNIETGEDMGVFNVRLVDREGELADDLVTSRGNWSGNEMLHLQRGTYGFEVESIGNWTVRIETSLNESGGTPELQHSGSRSEVFGPFDYEKTVEVTLDVRDDEHAVVDLYGPEGRFDSMLNLVGPTEDSMVYSDSRLHYVYVDTNSRDWSIELRPVD